MTDLDFWARRKRGVEAEAADEARATAQAEIAAQEVAQEDMSDEDILAIHDLPVPEDIETAEDVRHFLGKAVPQRLKTRALRQLWRLNPALANLDGLVDYGEDYTDAATVVENLQTAYQVGKGMLRALTESTPDPEDLDHAEEPVSDIVADAAPEADDITPPAPAMIQIKEQQAETVDEDQTVANTPRRFMRFSFDQSSDQGAA